MKSRGQALEQFLSLKKRQTMEEHQLLAVTADIHGDEEVLSQVIALASRLGASRLVIAGDLCPRTAMMGRMLTGAPFGLVIVRGNCDSVWDHVDAGLPLPREEAFISLPGGHSAQVTHGHLVPPQRPLEAGDACITGHSHIPRLDRDEEGIIHLNPGSPARPRGGSVPSLGLIYPDRFLLVSLADGRPYKELVRQRQASESARNSLT